jgi:hypothetical protein
MATCMRGLVSAIFNPKNYFLVGLSTYAKHELVSHTNRAWTIQAA